MTFVEARVGYCTVLHSPLAEGLSSGYCTVLYCAVQVESAMAHAPRIKRVPRSPGPNFLEPVGMGNGYCRTVVGDASVPATSLPRGFSRSKKTWKRAKRSNSPSLPSPLPFESCAPTSNQTSGDPTHTYYFSPKQTPTPRTPTLERPAMETLRYLSTLEATFDAEAAIAFTQQHLEIPVFAVGLYIAFVQEVPRLMSGREKGFPLKSAFAVWNFMLSTFSIIGASRIVPHLFRTLQDKGFEYTICESPSVWQLNDVSRGVGCGGVGGGEGRKDEWTRCWLSVHLTTR